MLDSLDGTAAAKSSGMKFVSSLIFLFLTTLLCRADELSGDVLREINLARMNPQRYASLLESRMSSSHSSSSIAEAVRFLNRAIPLPPLLSSRGLSSAAMLHVAESGPRGATGHGNAFGRMGRFGSYAGRAGENIDYGRHDARGIVMRLIVDEGVRSRGHRANLFSREFRFAGIACGGHARYGAMCVMDFASDYIERGGSSIAGL